MSISKAKIHNILKVKSKKLNDEQTRQRYQPKEYLNMIRTSDKG